MSYIIYTKPACPNCDTAKSLLTSKNIDFKAFKLGEDIEMDDFKARYPQARAVPFILNDDGSVVGGLADLRKLI